MAFSEVTHITHTLLMNHQRNDTFNHRHTKPTRWEESELVMWSNERDTSAADVNPHAMLKNISYTTLNPSAIRTRAENNFTFNI